MVCSDARVTIAKIKRSLGKMANIPPEGSIYGKLMHLFLANTDQELLLDGIALRDDVRVCDSGIATDSHVVLRYPEVDFRLFLRSHVLPP